MSSRASTPAPRRAVPSSVIAMVGAFMAMAYVLPNHSPPWMSFWQEGLVALSLTVLAAFVLLSERRMATWHGPELLVLGLLAIPAIQYLSGMIPFLQTAWMQSLYLLGLLLSLLTGAAMERRQPAAVLSLLLAAIWLAAVVSVGLQFYQWLVLQPGESTAWVYSAIGGRPSANLGQANSVGTIIVIALLGTYWLWYRATIGAALALAVATFLLMGLALTQSRTALLNALFIAASIYLWHRHRAGPRMTLSLLGLVVVLCVAFVGYSAIGRLAEQLPSLNLAAERASAGVRPLAWQVFADGVLQRPLGGYGWGQSFLAQVEVSLNHPPIHRVFLSAHNLLIDLALWSGLPIALLVLAVVAWWLRECIRRIEDEASMLLLLLIVVLLVHSLFEYPLAYAYFLLPAGLAAGALNQRMGFKLAWHTPAWVGAGLLTLTAVSFGVTVSDYLRVERSYRDLLFEKARIQSDVQGSPPDVLVLTSLRDLVVFSRTAPHVGMSNAELTWMADVVRTHPGAAGFTKVAMALAINGKEIEAQTWVDRLCSIFAEAQCVAMADEWSATAKGLPALRAISWP